MSSTANKSPDVLAGETVQVQEKKSGAISLLSILFVFLFNNNNNSNVLNNN